MLLPPTLTAAERRVEEGQGPAFLLCNNPNSEEVANAFQWFRVGGTGTPLSTRSRLTFNFPISRDSSGEYECQLVSRINGTTATARGELIVECKHCCCLLLLLLLFIVVLLVKLSV